MLSILALASAGAGTVVGRVTAHGKALPDGEATGGGAYDSRKLRFLEKVDYASMKDFVVWLEGGATPPPASEESKPVRVVVQKGGVFDPRVLPIRVGTTVEWPNDDNIYHNAFSFSEAKPFDLGLYKDLTKTVTFDEPGRVDVFCSIHKNMHCVILVLKTPWFAAVDDHGRYEIRNVPAGTYQLRAWHERLPPHVEEVTVPETGTVRVDVEMGISGIPQY